MCLESLTENERLGKEPVTPACQLSPLDGEFGALLLLFGTHLAAKKNVRVQ